MKRLIPGMSGVVTIAGGKVQIASVLAAAVRDTKCSMVWVGARRDVANNNPVLIGDSVSGQICLYPDDLKGMMLPTEYVGELYIYGGNGDKVHFQFIE